MEKPHRDRLIIYFFRLSSILYLVVFWILLYGIAFGSLIESASRSFGAISIAYGIWVYLNAPTWNSMLFMDERIHWFPLHQLYWYPCTFPSAIFLSDLLSFQWMHEFWFVVLSSHLLDIIRRYRISWYGMLIQRMQDIYASGGFYMLTSLIYGKIGYYDISPSSVSFAHFLTRHIDQIKSPLLFFLHFFLFHFSPFSSFFWFQASHRMITWIWNPWDTSSWIPLVQGIQWMSVALCCCSHWKRFLMCSLYYLDSYKREYIELERYKGRRSFLMIRQSKIEKARILRMEGNMKKRKGNKTAVSVS